MSLCVNPTTQRKGIYYILERSVDVIILFTLTPHLSIISPSKQPMRVREIVSTIWWDQK
jgi:hypothetical protein